MNLKRRLKSTAFLGLLFGLTLTLGITLVLNGEQRKYSVQASSHSEPSIFTFVATSGTECDVRLADKTVTRAIIPSTTIINGNEYTVTSIAVNSFSSAKSLEKVWLPKTIKTIGTTAFANCTSLKSITLPAVETIGANAFMQTGLEYLIIPDTTVSVGATILRNNSTKVYVRVSQAQTNGWTATWNSNNAQSVVD